MVLFWRFALVSGCINFIPRGFVVVVMQPWRNPAKYFSALPNHRNRSLHRSLADSESLYGVSIRHPRRRGPCSQASRLEHDACTGGRGCVNVNGRAQMYETGRGSVPIGIKPMHTSSCTSRASPPPSAPGGVRAGAKGREGGYGRHHVS